MNNKHYTPEIEEFHEGFEYEERPLGCQEFEGWVKNVVHATIGGSSIENIFRYSHVRVKYLDQEDIESLGFYLTPFNPDPHHSTDKVKSVKGIFKNDKYMIQWYGQEGLSISIIDNKQIVFDGKIKNISELKEELKRVV